MWFRLALSAILVVSLPIGERPVGTLFAQSDAVVSANLVALSRDGQRAATSRIATRGSKIVHLVFVHDLTNGTAIQQMTSLGNMTLGLQISADGKHVLVISAT